MRMQPAEFHDKATSALAPQGSSTHGHVPVAGTPSNGSRSAQAKSSGSANPQKSGSLGFCQRGTAVPCLGRGRVVARVPGPEQNTTMYQKTQRSGLNPPGKGGTPPVKTASTTHLVPRRGKALQIRPRVRGDYPPNLSILLSGGKETNRDSPSKCDRTGTSPA